MEKTGTTGSVPVETDWLPACFLEFVATSTPKILFCATLTLRGGTTQEYEQEALVCSRELLAQLVTLKRGEQIEVRLQMRLGEKVPCTLMALRKR